MEGKSLPALLSSAISELQAATAGISETEVRSVCTDLARARQIAVYGVGREGLAMHGLAMRLHHIGLDVSVAGDMTAACLGTGDVLLVSAGPGHFATVEALVRVARAAGAKCVCVTADATAFVPALCERVVSVPARTMGDRAADGADNGPILPMGSAYEGALFVLFEVMVMILCDMLSCSESEMRSRHTNLE